MYKLQIEGLCILANETGKPARQRLSSTAQSCSLVTKTDLGRTETWVIHIRGIICEALDPESLLMHQI